ncbi:hypothetical protein [Actinoplanes derwentensis]|uniref:Excreted virulence factor EspC, type VII ESX diderm n=1 Tax=Actinoplanes derwentensis TaxID=113562 RepID=A0A1H1XLM6_9ACTN|nr:hypothetical protein [Actinoplanes derwentensis]GID87741.1 hypothetical protein Ade03nite_66650 [Actinoplanes derwentensis]SDT10157.1 hypothetical protein SAMN04489716_2509 [Actinoplanes derwentensis]
MAVDITWPPTMASIDSVDPGFWKRYDEEHGWPPGTFRNVVDQIENNPPAESIEGDVDGSGPGGGSGVKPQKIVQYDDDEMAAYKYYQSAYSEEKWKGLVASYNEGGTTPGDTSPPPVGPGTDANGNPIAGGFNPDKTYLDNDNPSFTAPDPGKWTGEGDPKSNVSVNAQALIWMADQLKAVTDGTATPLDQAVQMLEAAAPRPGAFARAEALRQQLEGAAGGQAGLQVETKNMLMAVRSTVFQVETGLRLLAKNYESTEELNDLTADKLGEVMDGGWKAGTNISEYGKETTTEGA